MTDWIDMTDVIVDLVERNGWEPAPVIEIPDEYESAAAAPLAVEVPAAASAAPTLAAIPYCSPLEVAASTADRPEWLVPGYIALQAITELDGKIKSSGKTTWATHLVAAVLDGANFMGQPTTKTRVTYVTEQTQGSFREALSRAGLIGRGDELRLVFRREVGAMRWRDLIAAVVADAKRDGYGLLVIDTLGKLAGIVEENAAGEASAAMLPLQDAAHDGLAVLVCRHERKGGGEVGESGRGSSAISGDVDVILQLRRPEGNQPNTRRVIESLSRYDETPEKVVVELTDEGYLMLGDSEDVALSDALRIVSGLIGGENGQKRKWTLDELADEGEIPRTNVRRAIRELKARGEVQESGSGKRGDPYRYEVLEEVSSQTSRHIGQKPFRVVGDE